MKKYSCQIFINILLLIGVVYLFSMCSSGTNSKHNTIDGPYEINHYIDTIDSHIILTTVCYYPSLGYISINTLELKN